MKRNLLFVITVLFSVATFAQELKQFKGNTLDPTGWTSGVLTYTYYQKKSELPLDPNNIFQSDINNIKHGKYSVVAENSDQDRGSFKLVYSGNMKHGLRDGIWTFTENYIDFPIVEYKKYKTESVNIKMSFKDGVPDGQWSYSMNRKTRIRHYSLGGWSWHPNYETEPTENISFTFKNGVIVGQYIEKRNNWDGPVNISGSTNTQGVKIGKWSDGNDYGADGYLLIDDIDKELFNLKEQYKQLSTNEEKKEFCRINAIEVNEIHYSLTEHFRYRYYNTVDRTIQYTEVNPDNFLDSVPVMKSYSVKKLPIIKQLKEVYKGIEQNDTLYLVNFDKAISSRKELHHKYEYQLKEEWKNEILKDIKFLEELYIVHKEHSIEQEKVKKISKEINDIVNPLIETHGYDREKEKRDIIYKKYLITNYYEQYKFNVNEIKLSEYKKNHLKYIKEQLNEISSEKIELLLQLQKFDFINSVHAIYLKTRPDAVSIGNGLPLESPKFYQPEIYNSYIEIIGYLKNKPLTNQYSFIEEYNKYIEIQQLHDYVVSIVKAKTKPLEKELKSATTVEQKYEIFLRYMNM